MSKKLKCYYAHTMTSYGSTIEQQDLALLEKLGFKVVNPNKEKHQKGCEAYAKKYGPTKVMDYFAKIIDKCDIVAFRSIPDGRLLSGVAFEVKHAMDTNKEIIELPCCVKSRMMDYPATKEYLIDLGHYKV